MLGKLGDASLNRLLDILRDNDDKDRLVKSGVDPGSASRPSENRVLIVGRSIWMT